MTASTVLQRAGLGGLARSCGNRAFGGEWQNVIEIADENVSVLSVQGDFTGSKRLAVGSAKDWQSDLAVQTRIVRRPIDIEISGKAACPSVL